MTIKRETPDRLYRQGTCVRSAASPGPDSTAKGWVHCFNCVILLKTIRPGLNPGPEHSHTHALEAGLSPGLKYAFNLKNLQSHWKGGPRRTSTTTNRRRYFSQHKSRNENRAPEKDEKAYISWVESGLKKWYNEGNEYLWDVIQQQQQQACSVDHR